MAGKSGDAFTDIIIVEVASEAVRFNDQRPYHQELTLTNNTFAGGTHALLFEQAPDENTKLTVRNNYFAETARLAGVAGGESGSVARE